MKTLTSHRVNGLNEALAIKVLDESGQRNVCHNYQIQPVEGANESDPAKASRLARATCRVQFQNGSIKEEGVNGVSNEALLAIVEHRLQGFQAGDFACRENAIALVRLQECMMWLQKRTRDRVARGVEGTHQK